MLGVHWNDGKPGWEHRAGWELGEHVGECEHDGEAIMLANAPVRHEGWVGAGRVPSWMGAFRLGGCLRARWVLVGPVIHWVGAGGTSHIVSLHYVVLFYTNTLF